VRPQTPCRGVGRRSAKDLQAKREHLDGLKIEAGEAFDIGEWLKDTRDLFEDLRNTLEAGPAAGGQIMRHLLVGPISHGADRG
jgi:hypothetical protein